MHVKQIYTNTICTIKHIIALYEITNIKCLGGQRFCVAKPLGDKRVKITKYLSVLVLIMITLLLTGFTYAYWAGDVKTAEITKNYTGQTVVVGVANDTSTSITITEDSFETTKKLVPINQVEYSDGGAESNTSVKTLKVPVKWVQDSNKINPKNITGEVKVDYVLTATGLSSDQIQRLFAVKVNYDQTINLDGDAQIVTVTITMNDSVKEEEYNAVINAELSLQLDFTVTKK